MEFGRRDQPAPGMPSDLRRSLGEATDRIHEIVDAAERVAAQIRADAEADARSYLAERKAEADALAGERSEDLDRLTRTVADTADQFRQQAERMLADLDRVLADARAGVRREAPLAAVESAPRPEPFAPAPAPEPARTPEPELTPLPKLDFDAKAFERELEAPAPAPAPKPFAPAPEPVREPEPFERERPAAIVTAYPGRETEAAAAEPSARTDRDVYAEALLRATQLAVTGKSRDEIAEVLRADFPAVESESLLDEILR
ncbi:MAG: hypothetical protein QOI10_1504 [Solirubrobacterales bacterium]|jgi:hypothetical protein|nr:hypothetical protein [Solirubrobacterales bacterium]